MFRQFRHAFADLREFFAARERHQIGFGLFALIMPGLLIGMFLAERRSLPYKPPEVVFVKDYSGVRDDAMIRRVQAIDAAKEKAEKEELARRKEERRQQFEKLAKQLEAVGL